MTSILRTPDDRFEDLPDFDYKPNYLTINDSRFGSLRMHYVDEGPQDAPVILCLHGEPSWSFCWRKLIGPLSEHGYRVVAPDHIGFGRSDKLPNREDYSYQMMVQCCVQLIEKLDLRHITLVCQDWGGPVGLRSLGRMPERFRAVVAANTLLPNNDAPPQGIEGWPAQLIRDWVDAVANMDDMPVADIIEGVSNEPLPAEVKAAYDAPFPDASYKAGALALPALIPIEESMAGCRENRQVWERVLDNWHKPFVTAFSDGDPSTKAWEALFQSRIPGADNPFNTEIKNAGHFVQEDQGEALADLVLKLQRALDAAEQQSD